MRLILVRHGAVEGLDPPRFRGRRDIPLTGLGRNQAEATAEHIASKWKVDAVVTSPLSRSVETGRAIAQTTGALASVSELLIDFDYGEWAWKTHAEVQADWAELYDQWFRFPQLVRIPGGESLQDLLARAANALRFLLSEDPGRTVVAVAHDTINRAMLLQLLDMPLSAYWRIYQDPCCINLIDVDGRVEVRTVNDTTHLDGIG